MSLTIQLRNREDPIHVGVIGTGVFGSHTIYAIEGTPGMTTAAVADLVPEKARETLHRAGVSPDEITSAADGADATEVIASGERAVLPDGGALIDAEIDVVVDATGVPTVAAKHAFHSITAGVDFVNVSVEADTVVGPVLARLASANDVVYSLAFGDQPAQIAALADWAGTTGLDVVAAGRTAGGVEPHGTPDDSLERHGWIGPFVERYDPDPAVYNSFLDGTKIAVESCAAANILGHPPDVTGMHAPRSTIADLPSKLRPTADGGLLSHPGVVDAIEPIDDEVSVFVVTATENTHLQAYFDARPVPTASDGAYQCFHRSYHVAPETSYSIASAVLRDEPTGTPTTHVAEAVGAAKRTLEPGEDLDGAGGYTAYGVVERADVAAENGYVPVELLEGATVVETVEQDEIITTDHVSLNQDSFIYSLRRIQDDLL